MGRMILETFLLVETKTRFGGKVSVVIRISVIMFDSLVRP